MGRKKTEKDAERNREYQRRQQKVIGSLYRATTRYSKLRYRVRTSPWHQHCQVLVTREEFVAWFRPQDFEGCTIDRIDPKGHYELSNMRVTTARENYRRARLTFTETHGTCRKCKAFKEIELFCKAKTMLNGRTNICKACATAIAKANYQRRKTL